MKISINTLWFSFLRRLFAWERETVLVVTIAALLAVAATAVSLWNNTIVAYGDAESHLNIAKRVVDSLTPGFAQLGGIWLPLPHVLMTPFVYFDFLWRSGLAGSIVGGGAFVVASMYLFKLAHQLTKSKKAAWASFAVFALNPNILYLQSTPMTELPLLAFFILSSYFFIRFIDDTNDIRSLVLASFFGFCATLSRYDGWFLVLFEAVVIAFIYLRRSSLNKLKGRLLLFCTLAFFGIALWFLWDFLILGDPLYFTNSQYSAKTQQLEWLRRGELPAYHNLPLSVLYYLVTSMSNIGIVAFVVALIGFFTYMLRSENKRRYGIALVLLTPFIFNTLTLYLGQSVIFIPHITPTTFEWTLFNVRYGAMMVPFAALFCGYLFSQRLSVKHAFLVFLFLGQLGLYLIGYSPIISLSDGTNGLSKAKKPDAEYWMKDHYTGGMVLIDDYARSISVVRSNLPMDKIIYAGNRPYWQESLVTPQKHADWIIMQHDDEVYNKLYADPTAQANLYKYFEKVYTSPEILVFKRSDHPVAVTK